MNKVNSWKWQKINKNEIFLLKKALRRKEIQFVIFVCKPNSQPRASHGPFIALIFFIVRDNILVHVDFIFRDDKIFFFLF